MLIEMQEWETAHCHSGTTPFTTSQFDIEEVGDIFRLIKIRLFEFANEGTSQKSHEKETRLVELAYSGE